MNAEYFIILSVFITILILGMQLWRYYFVIGVPCKSKVKMNGKTVIITGANTGIGKETAIDLAKRGAKVIIACRNKDKAMEALQDIKKQSEIENITFKKLDLSSLSSVRKFSEEILQEEERIDVLINNAGVMFTPYTLTEDGFELQFGVNHLGHFLLTNLLLDRIKDTPASRIVVVSSHGHYPGYLDFEDMMWKKNYQSQRSYFRSKLANVMFARELSKRLLETGVTVYSLHPGSVNTELSRHMVAGWKIIFLVSIHLMDQFQNVVWWHHTEIGIHIYVIYIVC